MKIDSNKILFPHYSTHALCTVMLLNNLAEPDWVFQDCNRRIMKDVICQSENNKLNISSISKVVHDETVQNKFKCNNNQIRLQSSCYGFIWYYMGLYYTIFSNVKQPPINLIKIVTNIHDQFPDIFIKYSKGIITALTFWKEFLEVNMRTILISEVTFKGFILEKTMLNKISAKNILFYCPNWIAIHKMFICDKNIDCFPHGTDEVLNICQHEIFYDKVTKTKSIIQCNKLLYLSLTGVCSKFFSTSMHILNSRTFLGTNAVDILIPKQDRKEFKCKGGQYIHYDFVDDLVADCGPDGEDEPMLVKLLNTGYRENCTNPSQLSCFDGHYRCFKVSDICIFQLNKHKVLVPCRNGHHISKCKDFECDVMFKCFNSYCIPYSYMCDGKWDCPEGDDESENLRCENLEKCLSMYKCKGTNVCIHLGNICDSKIDCPLADDEYLCNLKHLFCPSKCLCLLYAVTCHNISLNTHILSTLGYYTSITIEDSNLSNLQQFSYLLHSVSVLNLKHNNFKELCVAAKMLNFITIDLGYNAVEVLDRKCISHVNELVSIKLNNNQIKVIHFQAFYNLNYLKAINLSSNPVLIIDQSIIENCLGLKSLEFSNIIPRSIDPNAFGTLGLKIFLTPISHYCCVFPAYVVCISQTYHETFDLCPGILLNKKFRYGYLGLSIMLFLLNFVSVFSHSLTYSHSKVFSASVILININDILMGLYLITILSADSHFQEEFILKDNTWKSSTFCFISFGTILWFSLQGPVLHIFLSLSRCMVVTHPIETVFKRISFTKKILTWLVIFTFILSCTVTIIFKFALNELGNDLCLPFVDMRGPNMLTTIVVWTVGFLHLVSSVIILFFYLIITVKVSQSMNKYNDKTYAKRPMAGGLFKAIIYSNLIGWFPTNILFITLMHLSKYSLEIFLLTNMLLLPLNSLLNPCVFIKLNTQKLLSSQNKSTPFKSFRIRI